MMLLFFLFATINLICVFIFFIVCLNKKIILINKFNKKKKTGEIKYFNHR